MYLATDSRCVRSQLENSMITSRVKLTLFLLLMAGMTGCGQIGPLYLPEPVEQAQPDPEPQEEESQQDQ